MCSSLILSDCKNIVEPSGNIAQEVSWYAACDLEAAALSDSQEPVDAVLTRRVFRRPLRNDPFEQVSVDGSIKRFVLNHGVAPA